MFINQHEVDAELIDPTYAGVSAECEATLRNVCTLPKEHAGPHVACTSDGKVCAVFTEDHAEHDVWPRLERAEQLGVG